MVEVDDLRAIAQRLGAKDRQTVLNAAQLIETYRRDTIDRLADARAVSMGQIETWPDYPAGETE